MFLQASRSNSQKCSVDIWRCPIEISHHRVYPSYKVIFPNFPNVPCCQDCGGGNGNFSGLSNWTGRLRKWQFPSIRAIWACANSNYWIAAYLMMTGTGCTRNILIMLLIFIANNWQFHSMGCSAWEKPGTVSWIRYIFWSILSRRVSSIWISAIWQRKPLMHPMPSVFGGVSSTVSHERRVGLQGWLMWLVRAFWETWNDVGHFQAISC